VLSTAVHVAINRILEDLLTNVTRSFFDREMFDFIMASGIGLDPKLATARQTNELSIFLTNALRGLVN